MNTSLRWKMDDWCRKFRGWEIRIWWKKNQQKFDITNESCENALFNSQELANHQYGNPVGRYIDIVGVATFLFVKLYIIEYIQRGLSESEKCSHIREHAWIKVLEPQWEKLSFIVMHSVLSCNYLNRRDRMIASHRSYSTQKLV